MVKELIINKIEAYYKQYLERKSGLMFNESTDFFFDSLMQTDFDLDKPFSFEINYQHETQPNDMLSVSRKQDNGATFVQILNSRGLSVAAKVNRL